MKLSGWLILSNTLYCQFNFWLGSWCFEFLDYEAYSLIKEYLSGLSQTHFYLTKLAQFSTGLELKLPTPILYDLNEFEFSFCWLTNGMSSDIALMCLCFFYLIFSKELRTW